MRNRFCRMPMIRACLVLPMLAVAGVASAQPSLTVSSDTVAPGASVTATVTGVPGQAFALIGSSMGAGFSHGGVPLKVGPDVAILILSTLDGTGQAQVTVTPPFL